MTCWTLSRKKTPAVSVAAGVFRSLPERAGRWEPSSPAKGPDLTAGDPLSRFSRGLRGKIIGIGMNDHGFPKDLPDGKPVSEKNLEGVAAVAEQGRQVARVIGMGAGAGVIVGQGACKRLLRSPAAHRTRVDVEREDTAGAAARGLGQAGHLRDDHSAPNGLIKENGAGDAGIGVASPDAGICLGLPPKHGEQVCGRCASVHGVSPSFPIGYRTAKGPGLSVPFYAPCTALVMSMEKMQIPAERRSHSEMSGVPIPT